jgi:hypothetical protein
MSYDKILIPAPPPLNYINQSLTLIYKTHPRGTPHLLIWDSYSYLVDESSEIQQAMLLSLSN